jgi:hypothetical protein
VELSEIGRLERGVEDGSAGRTALPWPDWVWVNDTKCGRKRAHGASEMVHWRWGVSAGGKLKRRGFETHENGEDSAAW